MGSLSSLRSLVPILLFLGLSLLPYMILAIRKEESSQSSPVQKRSIKKGIVLSSNGNEGRTKCHDWDAFSTVSWWYNYHTYENLTDIHPQWCSCPDGEPNGDPDCFPQNSEEIVFVPMIFGSDRNHHDTDPEVADYMDTVLGYNEPDKKNDISPVEAALQWSNLTQIYSDKILVSPATAGINTKWMDEFMEECELLNCRIDYLATHKYPKPGEEDAVMNELKNFSDRYGGRKIWLTEFAVKNTKEEAEIIKFVENFLPKLEEADFIWRYAWFHHRYDPVPPDETTNFWLDPLNTLVDFDSPKLTSVGKAYDHAWHIN